MAQIEDDDPIRGLPQTLPQLVGFDQAGPHHPPLLRFGRVAQEPPEEAV
jgi:hypothetical protein